MNKQVVMILPILSCFWTAACGQREEEPGSVVREVFVTVPFKKNEHFTEELARLVERHGMISNLGQATDEKGSSMYVLDATSKSVRLRSENALLSGSEKQELCGVYNKSRSDPEQYFISVSPRTKLDNPEESLNLINRIIRDLTDAGYSIKSYPVKCIK